MLYYIYSFNLQGPIYEFYLIEPIKQRVLVIRKKQHNVLLPEILWRVRVVKVDNQWACSGSVPHMRSGKYPWDGKSFCCSELTLPHVFDSEEGYCSGTAKISSTTELHKLFDNVLEAYWSTEFNGDLVNDKFREGFKYTGRQQLEYYLSFPCTKTISRFYMFNYKEVEIT